MRRPRLTSKQIHKAYHLLHMRYKPSEIALEIGLDVETIYKSLVPYGAPHERDAAGNIWIIGDEFAAWVKRAIVGKKHRQRMGLDQAYCMVCRRPVLIEHESIEHFSSRIDRVRGVCGKCGTTVYRTRLR